MRTARGLSAWAVLLGIAGAQACGGRSTGEASPSGVAAPHDGAAGGTATSVGSAGSAGSDVGSEPAVCTWPSAFNAPDPASGLCTAARAELSCLGSNGITEDCLSDNFSTCPDSSAGSVDVPNAVCKSVCKAGEFALTCGGIGPDAPSSSPPPTCRVSLISPGGPIDFCCPCGNGDGGVCAPLAPITSAVQLVASDIVAAGRAADGTEYVLTEHDSMMRLFVSDGFVLSEEFDDGTGEGVEGAVQFWTFQYFDQQYATVEVQKDESGTHMGVAVGTNVGKGFDVGSIGSVLTPIDPADAAAMSARTTQTFHVEYAGAAADGTNVVVVAPDHASSSNGFRVFLGPVGALQEQVVGSVTGGLSIPVRTVIQLTVNGDAAELNYEGASASLSGATQNEAFTEPAVPAAPAGANFLCR